MTFHWVVLNSINQYTQTNVHNVLCMIMEYLYYFTLNFQILVFKDCCMCLYVLLRTILFVYLISS